MKKIEKLIVAGLAVAVVAMTPLAPDLTQDGPDGTNDIRLLLKPMPIPAETSLEQVSNGNDSSSGNERVTSIPIPQPWIPMSQQPAILGAAGASNQIAVFPDANAPGIQNLVPGLPVGCVPHGVAYYGSDNALISDFNNSRVLIVQISTASLVSIINSSPNYGGTGTIAVAPNLTAALAMGQTNQLNVIHAPFGPSSPISQVTLPGIINGYQTQAIVFNNAGRAFVYHTTGISVLDAPYNSVAFTIPVAGNASTGAIAISPDGSTLLTSTLSGNQVRLFQAPFSATSTSTSLTIPGGNGLDGIMVTPNGASAIVVSAFARHAASIAGPFSSGSTVETLQLPVGGGTDGFEDVGISADSHIAILTGNSFTDPAVLVQAQFGAASVTSLVSIMGGATNPARGAGAVRFLPPGLAPGLTISKSAPATVQSGANLTYTISYGNTGTANATNVVIRDPLPAGTMFVSATNGGMLIGGNVVYSIGTVNAGATTGTVSFTVTVNTAGGGTVENHTYTIEGDGIFPIPGAPVSTAVTTPPSTPTPTATPASTPTPVPLAATISLPVATVATSITTFTQPVVASTIDAGDNLIGFQGDFTFDSTVVSFQSPPVSAAGLTANNWNVAGNVLPGVGPIRTLRVATFSNDGMTPLSGSGTLFTLNMSRVSSIPGASTALIWAAPPDDFEFINTDLDLRAPMNAPPGSITIQATLIQISGTASYCTNAVPDPVPNVTLTLTGTSSGSTLSNNSGTYQLSSLTPGGSYVVTPTKTALTPTSSGIDTVDAIAVQMHYLNIATLPQGCALAAADVNGDTLVNTYDAIAIQRFFIGRTFGIANVGKYKFTPSSRAYAGINGNQTNQDYDTMILGDVAAGFVHRADSQSQPKVSLAVEAVAPPEITIDQSKTDWIAPVTTSNIDLRERLVGFQGDFIFDERVITFQSEPVQKAGLTGGNWNVSGNVLDGKGPIRTLRISAFSNDFTPLSGSGTLFELRTIRVRRTSQSAQLVCAAPPDDFVFINANLNAQRPSSISPGSVGLSGKRK